METYQEWKERNDKASKEYWEMKHKEYIAKGGNPHRGVARGVDNGYKPSVVTQIVYRDHEQSTDMYGEFPLTI